MSGPQKKSPWLWIPTLYIAQGMPNALAVSVSVVLYKNMGLSNADITFYTGWLYLPWVIKPLWSPLVDLLRTRREWIWAMQLLLGALLAGVALTLPTTHFFQLSLAFFWLLAFASATHDVAADGFYILALREHQQSAFSGVRNTFFRVAHILAQGQLVILSGILYKQTDSYATAWMIIFALAALAFLLLYAYHRVMLPRPAADAPSPGATRGSLAHNFQETFAGFFSKPKIGLLLAFILLYRFGEAQLFPVVKLFLLGSRETGGLGLTNDEYGWINGTVGVAALMCGGLLGGWLVSRHGLKFWLWPMLFIIHLPDAVFIWLAAAQPTDLVVIGAGLAAEQFGYGFGFTAFMLYLIHIARGPHSTAHYALCTGFMALGMMVPGQWSGWLQSKLGYEGFFIWVILATIPSFIVAAKIPLEPEFGKKQ